MSERLLTPAELAERWSVTVDTVRRMVHRGDLEPVRLSARCWRFRLDEIERWELGGGVNGQRGDRRA